MSLLDDLVPESLQQWDGGLLDRLRSEGKGETLFFEFKTDAECSHIEKTVCAFANRLGGFLLLGVDAKESDNTIKSFPGLPAGTEWARRFTDCVVSHISPLPTWDAVQIASPDDSSRLVVAARIEQSHSTPHLLTRTGRIYLRNPTGSEPVTDKATLDALMARGSRGTLAAQVRADGMHATAPGTELYLPGLPSSYSIQIAAIPSPPLEDVALRDLLTQSGWRAAGGVFAHPSVRGLTPKEFREDRVLLIAGMQVAARMVDGAIFLCERSQSSYVGVQQLVSLIRGVLAAANNQHPPVRQVFLDMRVIGGGTCAVDDDMTGRKPSARPLATSLWGWQIETGTDQAAAERVSEACGRRLWRAVGDQRGLEPT